MSAALRLAVGAHLTPWEYTCCSDLQKEWKYVVRSTHPDNPNHKGTVSADGKVRTTFEEDVKVRPNVA